MSLLRWIAIALSAVVIVAAAAYLRDIGRAAPREFILANLGK